MNSSTHLALLFVFLWSSSYIALEFCTPHIGPATFVVIRTAITAFILYLVVVYKRLNWPANWIDCIPSIVVGILLHGVYTGGLFASLVQGMDIKLGALIVNLQPIVTVLLSALVLNEKLTLKNIVGILAGFLGVSVMILDGNATMNYGTNPIALALCFCALLAISSASIIQKRFCTNVEPLPGAFIQFSAAMYFAIPFAIVFESMQVNWVGEFILGLGWLVLFVSIGAITLLMVLIKNDTPSAVANLFYLVTPFVAIASCVLFGERLSLHAIIGMLISMSGVFLVNHVGSSKPQFAGARH